MNVETTAADAAAAPSTVDNTPLRDSAALHRSERDLLTSMEGEGELANICKNARTFALQPAMVMIAVGENALRGEVDHHEHQRRQSEGDQLLQQHIDDLTAKANTNKWYKVELRIARAVVNIAGKFEAELASSSPVYRPRLGGHGLPVFHYETSREQLGVLVERWMSGPEWERKGDADEAPPTPVMARDDSVEAKLRRKEHFEQQELAIEQRRGITRVRVFADFSNWGVIANATRHQLTPEDVRERNASIVVNVLNQAANVAHAYGLRFVYHAISIVNTQASMRCVFNGENWKGQSIFREREVEVLLLSHSNTSAKSLQNLNKAHRLKYLFLDGCPLATSNSKSGRTRADVFDELTQQGPVENLQCLSIVGTSAFLQGDWLTIVEQKCPKLQVVYFSRKPGDKALGWSDVVMMQSMREPRLLPCGHVGDALSLMQMRACLCPICRNPFRSFELVSLQASITQLTRIDKSSWKATIVDALRAPLDEKVLYHECGEFFNLASIRKLYNMDAAEAIDAALFTALGRVPCVKCNKLLTKVHVCYPRSAVEEDAQFRSLHEACSYLANDD